MILPNRKATEEIITLAAVVRNQYEDLFNYSS